MRSRPAFSWRACPMVGAGGHALWPLSSLSVLRRAISRVLLPFPFCPFGLPLTAFPLGPYLGDTRLPSSWRRFCVVGPSWLPAVSSSALGE